MSYVTYMPENIGDIIRKAREGRDLTQGELAEKINVVQSLISELETGKKDLTVDTIRGLHRELGIPLPALLGIERTTQPPAASLVAEQSAGYGKGPPFSFRVIVKDDDENLWIYDSDKGEWDRKRIRPPIKGLPGRRWYDKKEPA
ncbi:MAG: helix-turn-helix transcriptional regulator [Deltaproteobacteria bacterium]|nr:helix-turn-helix transcriptional regulator [Deltaproteobacteria bacterium]